MLLNSSRLKTQICNAARGVSSIRQWSDGQAQRHIEPLTSVLIANRGEIALRISRTASEHGVKATALYTEPDARSQHALKSKFSINIGDHSAYLNGDSIIEVAKREGCDCIHPGYGFLSENSQFAQKCADAGIVFIGPPPAAIEAMGNKSRSKEIMNAAGVPCIPGYHGINQEIEHLLLEAIKIGFPVLLKAVKGGGGKGMRISTSPEDFHAQLESAKSEARNSFGDDMMLVERFITTPRHIEVQIFADKHGNCVALGERDCSIQRRHQKIIEESPAPRLSNTIRKDLWQKARDAALAVRYEGAGTVEFIFDNVTGDFFFMEMNTRLQVEHPVTEMVTGQDLVHWQLQIAEGRELPLTQSEIEHQIDRNGWAFEARIYAENPDRGFVPDSGRLLLMQQPESTEHVRVDAGVIQGDYISSHYDPMIAKLIVRGSDRKTALKKLDSALQDYKIAGLATNIGFLRRICTSPDFVDGLVETGFIEKHSEELFAQQYISPEVWIQAAIGIVLQSFGDEIQHDENIMHAMGFHGSVNGYSRRQIELVAEGLNDQQTSEATKVVLQQKSPMIFDATVGSTIYSNISAALTSPNQLECYFPHKRLVSTVIQDGPVVAIFQEGKQYHIQQASPMWMKAALGKTKAANNVLAPMPCKILRVEITEGATVCKDQPLITIESMKMETVIRSPQNGKISKIMHQAGDICRAGVALVEFQESAV